MRSSPRPQSPSNYLYPYPESGLELYQPEHIHIRPPSASEATQPTFSTFTLSSATDKNKRNASLEKDGRIWGIKRDRLWIALVLVILVIIIAVLAGILGAAAGGDLNFSTNNPTSGTIQASGASSPTSTPTILTSPGPGGVTVECPSADGLNYTAAGSAKVFRRECNTDFQGGDMLKVNATSMQVCMNACAARMDCVAVTWDYAGLQGTSRNYCWMKNVSGVKSSAANKESALLWQ